MAEYGEGFATVYDQFWAPYPKRMGAALQPHLPSLRWYVQPAVWHVTVDQNWAANIAEYRRGHCDPDQTGHHPGQPRLRPGHHRREGFGRLGASGPGGRGLLGQCVRIHGPALA